MTDEGKPVEDELLQVPGDMVGLVGWTCRQVSKTGRWFFTRNWQEVSHQSLCFFVCLGNVSSDVIYGWMFSDEQMRKGLRCSLLLKEG